MLKRSEQLHEYLFEVQRSLYIPLMPATYSSCNGISMKLLQSLVQ